MLGALVVVFFRCHKYPTRPAVARMPAVAAMNLVLLDIVGDGSDDVNNKWVDQCLKRLPGRAFQPGATG